MTYNLTDCAIIANKYDNVAVAISHIKKGTKLCYDSRIITLQQGVPMGHRFAVTQIPRGKDVLQYGCQFGISRRNTKPGEILWNGLAARHLRNYGYRVNFSDAKPSLDVRFSSSHGVERPSYFPKEEIPNFMGYVWGSKPERGKVGTRKYIGVVSTSACSEDEVSDIVKEIASEFDGKIHKGLDGVVAIANTSGCECSAKRGKLVAEILSNYIRHPNIGAMLVVENGCEKTCLGEYKGKYKVAAHGKPIEFLSFQDDFGSNYDNTVEAGVKWVRDYIGEVAAAKRQPVPISYLNLGTNCGGSDGLSGFSGNAALGELTDLLVRCHGTAILSEIPEIYGAHHILAARGKNVKVAREIIQFVKWYYKLAKLRHDSIAGNPGPGNIEGGLINIILKSLGGIVKGGTTRVEGTADYGERITKQGLWVMQGTGGDIESMTGQVASGANLIAMTTGCGTPKGNPIVPVIKIVNHDKYPNADIFDYCTQPILSKEKTIKELGNGLLELMIRVASGEMTKSEIKGTSGFAIWPADTISM